MDIAVLRRHIVETELHGHGAASSRVLTAGVCHEQAAVAADRALDHVCGLVEFLVGKAVVHLLHDLLPEDDGGIRRRIRQHDLLGVIVAAPDDAGIIGRIARKPAVKVACRGAGLARDGHVYDLCGRAGAGFDGVLQHIGNIPSRHVLHRNVRLLRIIEHDLTVGVYDLRIRPRLTVHAFVCKRCVSLRHRLNGHALGKPAHRKRRQVNVRERVSRRVHIGRYKRAESHFFLCELEAVFRGHLRDELDGDRVDGKTHSLVDVHEAPVNRVGVFRPVPRVGKRIRRIVHDRRGRDEPELQRGRVDGNGLDGRARRQIALRRAVQDQAPLLLAHAAGHGHNVSRLIVNDNNARLQLLRACGVGDIIEVLINLLHCRLHVGVERGVNLIAARHEHLADDRLIVAGLFAEVPHDVVDDLIFKVGIVVLIAGRFAAGIMEHQLLRDGRVVLLLRDILLLEHLVENDDLPLLVLVGVDIRVVDRGVICDADERGALGKVELAHALAEIDLRRRLHALAVFAERDDVEIELHDLLFRVLLLKFQSAENFNQLAAHRDLVAARDIFDELLRDGRAAGLASSEEHFDAGL